MVAQPDLWLTFSIAELNFMKMWNKSFLQAIEIGKQVDALLPKTVNIKKLFGQDYNDQEIEQWIFIQGLQNCREQGITIWIPNVANKKALTFYVTFSRNTEYIGFYVGEHTMQGVSQDAYERGHYYFETVEDCVKEIVDKIKKYCDL
jgi:hypothetical protein